METESSLKGVVVMSLAERKTVGRINDLVIDDETLAIRDFVIVDGPTNGMNLLPFDKLLAIGDSFATIEGCADFRKMTDTDIQRTVSKSFKLVDTDVFSKVGNKVGTVKSFEFSPIDGNIRCIVLTDGTKIDKKSFIFFSNEYVFIDDGSKTLAELRAEGVEEVETVEEVNEDAELFDYLLGKVTTEIVSTPDGSYGIEEGVELTEELLVEAKAHDLLTLLIMSVK